jgi:hypothetical protein
MPKILLTVIIPYLDYRGLLSIFLKFPLNGRTKQHYFKNIFPLAFIVMHLISMVLLKPYDIIV